MGNARLYSVSRLTSVRRMGGGFSWLKATTTLAFAAAAHPSIGRLFGSWTWGDPHDVV